jgi:hypothetical protein
MLAQVSWDQGRLLASLAALLEGEENGVGMRRGPLELQNGRLELAGAVTLEEPAETRDDGLQGVSVLGRPQEEFGARRDGVDQAVGGAGAVCPAPVIAQRLDMGGILDLRAGVIAARVTGDQDGSVEDADLFGIGEEGSKDGESDSIPVLCRLQREPPR